ncbi:hypothetical protein GWI33_018518 [Rhynchophorus ferrugineus]|uniref:Uncharacterized protein n=1 Tax=Rhynchophorus ferrugineus TaxID=354439 RepID=A0A834HW79_RHYFE|nr:hypothetical protein GWI33_018518 [Rhynchophorus ferrugineus]
MREKKQRSPQIDYRTPFNPSESLYWYRQGGGGGRLNRTWDSPPPITDHPSENICVAISAIERRRSRDRRGGVRRGGMIGERWETGGRHGNGNGGVVGGGGGELKRWTLEIE